MPGESIWSWSTTAADNATADSSINLAEGHARNLVNDNKRSMMAAIAKWLALTNGSKTTGGSANAQTLTTGMSFTSVPTGMRVLVKNGFTNTDSMTLNMDGIGAVTVKDIYANSLVGGEVRSSAYSEYVYDGTNWILLQEKTGRVLLAKATASAAAAVDFTTGIDDTYDEYIFVITDLYASVDGPVLQAQVSTDGGSSWKTTGTDYKRVLKFSRYSTGATTVSVAQDQTIATLISNSAAHVTSGEMRLFKPSATSVHQMRTQVATYTASADIVLQDCTTAYLTAAAVNAIRFILSSGTITTTIEMYGVRK
jgi:hypothetical protein